MNTSFVRFLFVCIIAKEIQGTNFRLPATVKPLFYSIKIHPNLNDDVFDGEVTIKVKIKNTVDSIILHCNDLTIETVMLDTDNNMIHSLDPELDFLTISPSNHSKIASGIHSIFIKYSGKIGIVEVNDKENDDEDIRGGFIRFTSEELKSYYGITDIGPYNAREVFPCFDEPAFMAQFQLTLVLPDSNYSPVSNTHLLTSTRTSNNVEHKFDITPTMSTDQLCFAISDFNVSETKIVAGNTTIDIRFNFRDVGLDVNEKFNYITEIVKFLANYTNSSYPLSKIDFVEESKSTYESGWGFVTIPSENITELTDSDKKFEFDMSIVFAWFDGFVTNQWWNDLSVKASLAGVIALKLQSANQDCFIFSDLTSYLMYQYDYYVPSEPVVLFLDQPEDFCKFDSFNPFLKGIAIFQMAETVIGETKFQKIVQNFVNNFAYKTFTTKDLIMTFENLSDHKELTSFLKSYLHQSKFPILHVQEDEKQYILTQEHYDSYLDPNKILEIEEMDDSCTERIVPVPGEKWTIPITYITDLNSTPSLVWFHKDMSHLAIPNNGEEWIKFNYKDKGYYRTIYPKPMWNKFLTYSDEIGEDEKFHLAFEALQLWTAGLVPCGYTIKLIEILANANHKNLILLIGSFLQEWLDFHYDDDAEKIFEAFVQVIVKDSSEEASSEVEESVSKLMDFLDTIDNSIPKVSEMRRRRREIARANFDSLSQEESDEIIIPEHIQQCFIWMKENLSQYQVAA